MRATFAVFLVGIAGCIFGGPGRLVFPRLHAVSGVVTQNTKPVSGGMLQFTLSSGKRDFLVTSVVESEGKFRLNTAASADSKGERHPGAPSGLYQVTYIPLVTDQTTGLRAPLTLPRPVEIQADDSNLKIELSAKN